MAHGVESAAAVLWLNAADTYVDVWEGEAMAMADEGIGSAWLSEGGGLELLMLGGPTSRAVLRQLAFTTGRPPMPPLWSLGIINLTGISNRSITRRRSPALTVMACLLMVYGSTLSIQAARCLLGTRSAFTVGSRRADAPAARRLIGMQTHI